MPGFENIRAIAEAIGRVKCIKTGIEIGLLYRWDNGETQAALYDGCHSTTPNLSDHHDEPDNGANRS